MPNPGSIAIAIYVAASRDFTDALDMIAECDDAKAMGLLVSMLETKGQPNTDEELNDLLVGPARRRLEALRDAR
jgi:hypothetical protein